MRGGQIPSPCVSICRIDPASGLCEGCLRTLDEIAAWGSLGDDARRAIWSAIGQRRALRPGATGHGELRRDRSA
ncbi:MAG TPA: DUF1289 domain-containing protein [Burkholderiaceae bacterium]|nr:DUF1289 domain-containing protein [Burkholderiaceae bacterium]